MVYVILVFGYLNNQKVRRGEFAMKKIIVGILLIGLALVSISKVVYRSRNQQEYFETNRAIKHLVVEDKDATIKVIGTADRKTVVEYIVLGKNRYLFDESGETLSIRKKQQSTKNFSTDFSKPSEQIEIRVPKENLSHLLLEASNTEISVDSLMLQDAEIRSSNDEIHLEDVAIRNNIVAKTNNGDLILKNITFGEGKFSTTNAHIDINEAECRSAEFRTNDGDITFNQLNTEQSLRFNTSNADIEGILIGQSSDFSIDARTIDGDNNLKNSSGNKKDLNIVNKDGEIKVDFQKK